MDINIRLASYNDLEYIYNQAIDTRCSTGDISYMNYEDRINWFEEHDPEKYPVLIGEIENDIVGWISLSPYRKGREGLKYTIEVSYYVHENYKRKGIGSELLSSMIELANKLKYKTIIAILFNTNIGSIKLLENNNFEKWGLLPDVIEIDRNIYSHLYYGLKI